MNKTSLPLKPLRIYIDGKEYSASTCKITIEEEHLEDESPPTPLGWSRQLDRCLHNELAAILKKLLGIEPHLYAWHGVTIYNITQKAKRFGRYHVKFDRVWLGPMPMPDVLTIPPEYPEVPRGDDVYLVGNWTKQLRYLTPDECRGIAALPVFDASRISRCDYGHWPHLRALARRDGRYNDFDETIWLGPLPRPAYSTTADM